MVLKSLAVSPPVPYVTIELVFDQQRYIFTFGYRDCLLQLVHHAVENLIGIGNALEGENPHTVRAERMGGIRGFT